MSNREEVAAYVNIFKEMKAIAEIADYEPETYSEYEAFVKEVEANPNDKEAALHIRGYFLEFHNRQFWRNAIHGS